MNQEPKLTQEQIDGIIPVFRELKSTKKTRADDKRGPNHSHPISRKKETAEERLEFSKTQFRPKVAGHPLKDQILVWFEEGHSSKVVHEKLQKKAIEDGVPFEKYSLSVPTLVKLKKRHLLAIGAINKSQLNSRISLAASREMTRQEKVLWDTIEECKKKKTDTTISPKDWQYFDMQQQAAISLLNELGKEGKSGEDISIVLSRVFAEYFKRFSPNAPGPKSVHPGETNGAEPAKDNPV